MPPHTRDKPVELNTHTQRNEKNWGNLNKICGLHQCQYPGYDTLLYCFARCYHWVKGTWNLLFMSVNLNYKITVISRRP